MRMRTVFSVLQILVLLIESSPALLAAGRREIAEAFGCEGYLNRVIPCVIGGKDYGRPFYDLGFSIWYPYLIVPIGFVLLGVWAVAALIALIMNWRTKSSDRPGPC